jgi:hypothetical protein
MHQNECDTIVEYLTVMQQITDDNYHIKNETRKRDIINARCQGLMHVVRGMVDDGNAS